MHTHDRTNLNTQPNFKRILNYSEIITRYCVVLFDTGVQHYYVNEEEKLNEFFPGCFSGELYRFVWPSRYNT